MRWIAFLVTFNVVLLGSLQAEKLIVKGRTVDSQGGPVAGAVITVPGEPGVLAESGSDGEFGIDITRIPPEILVSHPSFETVSVSLDSALLSGTSGGLEITLQRRIRLSEEITVMADAPEPGFSPGSAATATLDPSVVHGNPSALKGVLENVPGLAANGQGGLFQVYSVRGISRQRIKTSLAGIRLEGERRAGVSASFVDPFLMESIDVLKGPASAYHGSGALGGVVRINPRRFRGTYLDLGYQSAGNEYHSAAGWGDGKWSLGFARREAGDAEAPNGAFLNSHFSQYSGLISGSWDIEGGDFSFAVIPTLGSDIGKASTDYYKGRVTEYPSEKHVAARLELNLDSGWEVSGFLHPHSYSTRVEDSEGVARVDSGSLDAGADLKKRYLVGSSTLLTLGADYFSRSGVKTVENQWSFSSPETSLPFYSLDGASLGEAGIGGDLRHESSFAVFEGGLRFIWSRRENGGSLPISGSSWGGYGGITIPAGQQAKIKASAGTGVRFPSLSELFYGGTTGRGTVQGNPGLDPERSISLEGGFEWAGENVAFSTYLFRNRVDEFIERVEVDPVANPDHLTYINLTRGTISGVEWEVAASPFYFLECFWRGHLVKGTDGKGESLADIPVPRTTLGAYLRGKGWRGNLSWQYRSGKDDPGSGEKVIGSAGLLEGYIQKRVTSLLEFRFTGSNLTNEAYFNSADKKVPLSPGRSVSLSIRLHLDGS